MDVIVPPDHRTALYARCEFLANRLVRFIDRRSVAVFLALSAWYLASAILLAFTKLLWNDELLTLYYARIPNFSDLWHALSTTHEQSPPLFYLITRRFLHLTSSNEFNIRFPQIVGVWVGLFCIFLFVKRRASGLHGLLAALFPLTTSVFYYSHEARPYGLMLGFAALSLILWQLAGTNRNRKLVLSLLAVSNMALAGSHYYGFLGVVPLFIGELVGTFEKRRFDTAVWISLCVTVVPLMFVLPIIRHGGALASDFWAQAKWSSMIDSYKFVLEPALIPLVGVVLLASLDSLLSKTSLHEDQQTELTRRELAAMIGLLLVPVFAVIISKSSTRAFTDRYALISVIGFSTLLSLAARRIFGSRKTLLLGIGALLFLFSSAKVIREYRKYTAERTRLETTLNMIDARIGQAESVAIGDPHLFFQLSHYAPADQKTSMIYIADAAAAREWVGTSWVDLTMEEIAPWIPLNVIKYSLVLDKTNSFLVYSNNGRWEWLVRQLQKTGGRLIIIERNDPDLLLKWDTKD